MKQYQNQRGVVLLVALVFLLILTVAGVSAMRLANVEERMTGNFSQRNQAFQAAEAALVEAERFLDAQNFQQVNFFTGGDCDPNQHTCFYNEDASNAPTCNNGLCFFGTYPADGECSLTAVGNAADEAFQQQDVWDNQSRLATVTANGEIPPARFLIEFRCFAVKDPDNPRDDQFDADNQYIPSYWEPLYRITALGFGDNPNVRVMLQSTFRRN